MSTPGQLAAALTPSKLRSDGLRLGLVAVLSILYALVFEQAVLDIVLVALNGFGALVGALASIVAALAIRRHGRAAAIGLAVYGACLAGHLTAIVLLLGG